MKVISAIVSAIAATGLIACCTGTASASTAQCGVDGGGDVTIVNGATACRATAARDSHARSAGLDGVGYAQATAGATALALGAGGGIGASQGAAGIPVAIGMGPDALAFTSIAPEPQPGRIGVSLAMNGSRAQVISSEHSTVCLGSAALAWDSRTGAACLATPFGLWHTPAARRVPRTE